MHSRREFLSTSIAAAGVVTWGQTAPLFLSRTAQAAPATNKPGAKETVLVVVQLTGGNDGLEHGRAVRRRRLSETSPRAARFPPRT